MEGSSSEHGTHDGLHSTNLEQPFSEEFPPNKVMTFAAEASATPTPTKQRNGKKRPNKRLRPPINSPTRLRILRIRRSANKRPSKRPRAPLTSPQLLYSNKEKVTTSDTTLYSKHFDDYRTNILAEFKSLYRRSKKTITVHTRISNLNEHDLTPPSLRTKPPNLNIEHKELNMSMCNEFDTITKHYNKELTRCYIKHLDLLAHSYAKDLDDFPNKVRLDISKIAEAIQQPLYSHTISSHTNITTFKETLRIWQENFAIEILEACDDFAMNHTIEATIRLNATKYREKSFINDEHLIDKTHISIVDTSYNLNHKEIDIEMSEENDYEDYYNSPSQFTTPGNTSSAKHISDVPMRPFGPKKVHPNPNHNLKTNPITNPKPNQNINPNPNLNTKTNPNPNPNPNPKTLQQRLPRPSNHHSLPRYTCNIATNEVSRNSSAPLNPNDPIVRFYNPYRVQHQHQQYGLQNSVLGPYPLQPTPFARSTPDLLPHQARHELLPPQNRQHHRSTTQSQYLQNRLNHQFQAPPTTNHEHHGHPPSLLHGREHRIGYEDRSTHRLPPLHNVPRGATNNHGHTYPPYLPPVYEHGTVCDSHLSFPPPPPHNGMPGTAYGSRYTHTHASPLLPTPHQNSHFQNPNYPPPPPLYLPSSHPPSHSHLFPNHTPILLSDNWVNAPPLPFSSSFPIPPASSSSSKLFSIPAPLSSFHSFPPQPFSNPPPYFTTPAPTLTSHNIFATYPPLPSYLNNTTPPGFDNSPLPTPFIRNNPLTSRDHRTYKPNPTTHTIPPKQPSKYPQNSKQPSKYPQNSKPNYPQIIKPKNG